MKIKQLLIAACIGTMFTACSSDDTARQNAERVPINFTANIQQLIPSAGTRVSNGTTGLSFTEFADESEISVGFYGSGNSVIKKTDGVWDYKGDKLYYSLDGTSQYVYGLYPKQANSIAQLTHGVAFFNTPTDQSTLASYQSADIMGAVAAISTPTLAPVTLNFKHLGAKIVVNILGGTIPSTFTVTMKNIITKGSFSGGSNEIELYGISGSNPITLGKYSESGQAAIIIPQEVAASTALFEVGTGDVTYTYTTEDAITFKAGYEYTFNLTISQTAINLSNITVTDWDTDPAQSGPISGDLEK